MVWQAFGDGMLRQDAAELHRRQVQEAVRRSAAEVFAASCGVELQEPEQAEALLPVPLRPGEQLKHTDVLPDGSGAPLDATPNHWPLYWFRLDGTVIRRVGEPHENRYQVQEDLGHPVFTLMEAQT